MRTVRAVLLAVILAALLLVWAGSPAGANTMETCDGHSAQIIIGPNGRNTTTVDIYPDRLVVDTANGRGARTYFVRPENLRTVLILDFGGDVNLTVHDGADVRRVCTGSGDDMIDVGKTGAPGVFVATGGGDDVVRGSNGPDRIFAGAGDDIVDGLGGDDWLDGGTGGNSIDGGPGTDSCSFTPSRALYPGCEGGLTVQSTASAPGVFRIGR